MFFYQNLKDFQAFVDSIYSKLKYDSQYQNKEVQD